jgi:hypothetical protein
MRSITTLSLVFAIAEKLIKKIISGGILHLTAIFLTKERIINLKAVFALGDVKQK